MFEPTFLVAADRWIDQQKELTRLAPRDTSLAMSLLPGAAPDVVSDALRSPVDFFDPMAKIQDTITSTMSSAEGITSLMNLVTDTATRELEAAQREAGKMQSAITSLSSSIASPPPATDVAKTKVALIALEDLALRAELAANQSLLVDPQTATIRTVDAILSLLDSGVLDRAQVEAYLSGNPVQRQAMSSYMVQVVDRVGGERVWRIRRVEPSSSVQGAPASAPSASSLIQSGVRLVDEDGRDVRDMIGATDASLSTDGTLLVRGLGISSGAIRRFQLIPITPAPAGRLPQASLKPVGGELDLAMSGLEDSMAFDIWACLVLDIGQLIESLYYKLRARISGLITTVRSALLRIISGEFLGAIPDLEVTWRSPVSKLIGLLDNVPAANPLRSIIKISGQIKPVKIGNDNLALCGVEQGRHCEAHSSLIDLRKELAKLDQQVQFKLAGLTIAELAGLLGYDPSVMIDLIDAALAPIEDILRDMDDDAAALRGEVCAWVRNRQASIPPSLSALQANVVTLIATIAVAIPALLPTSLGLPVNLELVSLTSKMRRMGFSSMAGAMESIDFGAVYFSGYRGGTPAADLADVLAQAAASSQRTDNSAELQKMSVSVMDSHLQVVTRQKNRATIQSRYHAKRTAAAAEDVRDRARPMIREVDREAMQNR